MRSAVSIKTISSLFLGFVCLTGFSFNEKWARYPRPDEILMIFQDRFADGFANSVSVREVETCRQLTQENRSFLGDNRSADGKPIVSEPNLHFAKWYTGCLADAVGNEVAFLIRNQVRAKEGTLELKILEWVPLPDDPILKQEMIHSLVLNTSSPAKQGPTHSIPPLSSELRLHVVKHVLARLIGPDRVLNEKPPLFNAEALRNYILSTVNAMDFSASGFQSMGFRSLLQQQESSIYGYLATTMLIVGLQDEFLIQ